MNPDPHLDLVTSLARLEQVLVEEDVALRRFDTAGIALAAAAKAELEPELQRAFAALGAAPVGTPRAELSAIRERIASRGRANLIRLQATLGCVRDLVDQASGRSRVTYGRRQPPRVEGIPMLASEVG
jgi:hypothetical protein